MNSKTKVINILGGPGAGKSTVATGVFSKMKQMGINCEYVSEYAKDVTWEETNKLLENQIHIFAEQFRRQWRLINKVDYIVTDCPLILSSVYFEYFARKAGHSVFTEEYNDLTSEFFDRSFAEFNNLNFSLARNKEYVKIGRNQSELEALEIDDMVRNKICNGRLVKSPGYNILLNNANNEEDVKSVIENLYHYEKWEGKHEIRK